VILRIFHHFLDSLRTTLFPKAWEVSSLTVRQAKTWLKKFDDAFEKEYLNSFIDFSGLQTISPEVARVLAKTDGGLCLNGLTTITPEVAEALAKHEYWLGLSGLTTISPEVAEALARHEGPLSLDGLTTITPEVAEALAKHKGVLDLDGLTEITPEVLKILRANPNIKLPSEFDEKP
jgi:anti-anti-sigma regulatory factor